MNSLPTRAEGKASPPSRISRLTMPTVLAGVALVAMSISGTAIALPQIGSDLNASGSALNWVVAGYNLAFAAMTLVAGAAADRFGRRRVFAIAATLFAGGFAATGLAPSIVFLDLARILSGIGGAGVMAAGGALLASVYAGAARNRAFAFMGTMAGVGIAAGPTLVGGLIAATGWRGSFAAFAIVAALLVGSATRLRESRDLNARTDWVGSGLFVATLGAVMFALLEGPEIGWAHPVVIGSGLLALLSAAALVATQRRSKAPLLAAELVTNHGFMAWSLATLTTSVGFLGVLVFLPTYLQSAAGLTPVAAGLAMLLLTAPVLVTPVAAVWLVNRGVSASKLIMVALALVVIGNAALLLLGPTNTTAIVAVPLLLIGIGMGASFGITDGQAMALVPARMVGTAAGFLNTLRGASEALVIAAFSASLIGVLLHKLGDSPRAAEVAAGRLAPVDDPGRAFEIESLTDGWHVTQLAVAVLCLLLSAAVAALLVKHRRCSSSDKKDLPRQKSPDSLGDMSGASASAAAVTETLR